ncbi:hypothetical protein PCYB_005440, partial [Plasmodium cynomolgi strain B]
NLKDASHINKISESKNLGNYIKPDIRCIYLNIWLYCFRIMRCVPDDVKMNLFSLINNKISPLLKEDHYYKCNLESYNYAQNGTDERIMKLIYLVTTDDEILNILFERSSGSLDWCDSNNVNVQILNELKTKLHEVNSSSVTKRSNVIDKLETLIEKTKSLSSPKIVEPPEKPDIKSDDSISTIDSSTTTQKTVQYALMVVRYIKLMKTFL